MFSDDLLVKLFDYYNVEIPDDLLGLLKIDIRKYFDVHKIELTDVNSKYEKEILDETDVDKTMSNLADELHVRPEEIDYKIV